jgi:hypothetical protein
MGYGTKDSPYTRRDVLRRIQENNLDFTGKVFEEEINLKGKCLSGVDFAQATFLYNKDTYQGANFQNAHLENVNFEEADLHYAHLEGAFLTNAKFSRETNLEEIKWGKKYILGEEESRDYSFAQITYRKLKTWYTEHGIYDVAGQFFFREMTAKRKAIKWCPNPFKRIISKLFSLLCGYGEKPERVGISATVIILGLALVYYLLGSFGSSISFLNSLYYSAVSFVALGYGTWVIEPVGWAKYVGALEAGIGVFMMALFLVTFTRKMTR